MHYQHMVNTHLRKQNLQLNKLVVKADNGQIFVGPMRPNTPLAPPVQQILLTTQNASKSWL